MDKHLRKIHIYNYLRIISLILMIGSAIALTPLIITKYNKVLLILFNILLTVFTLTFLFFTFFYHTKRSGRCSNCNTKYNREDIELTFIKEENKCYVYSIKFICPICKEERIDEVEILKGKNKEDLDKNIEKYLGYIIK